MDLSRQKVVVCGGGGFIGGHLIKQLLRDGVNVIRSVDVKPRSEWYQVHAGVENVTADLKQIDACHRAVEGADAIFNLAADMGGMGFNQLVDIAEGFAGIKLKRTYNLNAPRGVNGRNSDNTLIQAKLEWEPSTQLKDGLRKTYDWIESQVEAFSCV
jgi:nucleoside-diphosphate-sugar epimerase